MRLNRNIFINLSLTIFFSGIVYLLIIKKLLYPTIPPMFNEGALNIFVDWSVILSANYAKIGLMCILVILAIFGIGPMYMEKYCSIYHL